jgi:hypothetical protein
VNPAGVLQPEVGFPSNFLDPSTINLKALQQFHIRSVDPEKKEPMVQQCPDTKLVFCKFLASAKAHDGVESVSRSAEALLPPHECGGSHHEF